ncbi:MAG: asparaginase, partial [Actinomycetota bacterium]
NGWPIETYLDMSHPLQRAIVEGLAHLISRPTIAHIGSEGCGAPTHVLQLIDLARAFRAIASGAAGSSGERIARAMTTHPAMVGGPGHVTTALMRGIPGLVLKDGAEGVFAGALADGRALALKIGDGSNRARPPVMRAALRALDVDMSKIDEAVFESPVLGHGHRVGQVRCVGELATFVDTC